MRNILFNHLYKPRRLLYYVPVNDINKEKFFAGIIPDELLLFDGQFGTYDAPGLFIVDKDGKKTEVIGIEFRPDDETLDYPVGLDSLVLDGSYMISAEFTDDGRLNDAKIEEAVKATQNAKMFFEYIHAQENPGVIEIFTHDKKNHVYIQCDEVSEDRIFGVRNPQTDREIQLYNLAFHDGITGYYNWNYLNPIIEGYAFKGIQDFAFVHFDVKDFNAINVIYGHDVANKLLVKITQHMEEEDWIYYSCRCDNDNFAMMIKDMPEYEMQSVLMNFFEDLSHIEEDRHYRVFYRCGVVSMKNTLLLGDRVADGAKLAQRLGIKLNTTEVNFYTDEMKDENFWAKKIKSYLDTAIEHDEFLVYLQPKYDIHTETIKGAEALIRWNYRGCEMLSPAKFIPIFEKEGSISKIDDIVLNTVCRYLKRWKEEGLSLYPISVNLSRKRLENPNLIEHLTKIVDSYGVDHSLIDFELTETVAYNNQDYMISVISMLKAAGFKTSIDDFGTGYSSLSLLTLMPLDTLKIDKSFVDGIGTDKETYKEVAVIEHVIAMAKALGLNCLAEGAEEKSQVDKLREFGCEMIQGYYYSKPLPVEEYELKVKMEA